MSVDLVAKALHLVVEYRLGLLRLGPRNEGAGIELSFVAEAALEPDGELACDASWCSASR
jgi:hypothetical protein